ncbi:MAG TPA: HAD family hydrolase, partial [Clostridiales bacterium]|nr:HAD family hydrolase [Clostridiales bacterium]
MQWHSMTIEETVKQLNTSLSRGLASEEVLKRQKTYGLNRLEVKKGK